ncbi:MAG: hypothetical protein M1405_02595 [Patescibacteria group bacterium]|nr:hypothetical protein [Patescibacteria group bacterium]
MSVVKFERESRGEAAKRLLREKQVIISEINERGDVFSRQNHSRWERVRQINEVFSGPLTQDYASRPISRRGRIIIAEGMIGQITIPLPPKKESLFVRTRHSGTHL